MNVDIKLKQKYMYLFLFSEDYKNWKIITISDNYQDLLNIFIPNYLQLLGIVNKKEQNQIINGLISSSMESIVFVNSFFKIKKFQANNIIEDDIILIQKE